MVYYNRATAGTLILNLLYGDPPRYTADVKPINIPVHEKEYAGMWMILQGFEISRTFLGATQVGKKRGKFQNPVKIVHIPVVLIYFELNPKLQF